MPQHIIIAGGGSAGWMAAALFARLRPAPLTRITLVESDAIGTIGVGEATVPILQDFNRLLGVHEPEFVAATQGSFKLGIEFVDWGHLGNRHFHGFGDFGAPIEGTAPHHHWHRLRTAGREQDPIDAWSMPAILARQDRFAPPEASRGEAAEYRYAYHFDAGLYACLLRSYAQSRGVAHMEGRIVDVERDPHSGDVAALRLDGDRRLDGDIFIDCTGFASRLLGAELGVALVDWSGWLPANRAIAQGSARAGRFTPFTRSTALTAGWQWRIPLQHRTGNGLVYSSRYLSDDEAAHILTSNLDGDAIGEPRLLRFTTGRREQFWAHNVIAIGLAAGFMEPLESTSLQLVQTGLARLAELLPHGRVAPPIRTEYNRETIAEYERIRDFLIAHYCISQRPEPFWRDSANMALPDTLTHKLALWDAMGRVPMYDLESHAEPSWAAILLGQGRIPQGHDPAADRMSLESMAALVAARRDTLQAAAARLPQHDHFVRRTCHAQAA
ncbi:tryptophan halogenase family protein [Sphingomonas sp. HT-1]|uniref:tryptophan halogenase family protein n=1 Tax=unclassified Sphingomonas TaxID=196159 RepID=UPI0003083BD5|nr:MULTISPECIES: tryptophan halogenase family protein [unclassified Sphingomonas]KTF68502.1 tryptophan halogenase [Sphingomonas sp. WG]